MCAGDSKMLGMPELRDSCPGVLHTGGGTCTGEFVFQPLTLGVQSYLSPFTAGMEVKVERFSCFVSALLWPSVSSLCSFSSLLYGNVYSVPQCVGSM